MKKYNIIIDCDPGIDDAMAIMLALYNPQVDIKLITTVSGNIPQELATRNALHLVEKFGAKVPVAAGASKPLFREPKNASFIHGTSGLGDYGNTVKTPKKKIIKKDAVEAMHEVINKNAGDIIILAMAPQTNIGALLTKYPEDANKISAIYYEGGSPYGYKKTKPHISFNLSSDPEAFKLVLDSGIKLYMVPSETGRIQGHFTEKQVNKLAKMNDAGKFLSVIFAKYWEKNFTDKRVATNDTCPLILMLYPKLFKLVRTNIVVDCDKAPGKTVMDFDKNGKITYVMGLKRFAFQRKLFKMIKNIDYKD